MLLGDHASDVINRYLLEVQRVLRPRGTYAPLDSIPSRFLVLFCVAMGCAHGLRSHSVQAGQA